MREKPNQFMVKMNDLKKVAATAENYSSKRLMLIFNNTESRLKDIPGIDDRYHLELQNITRDCLQIMDSNIKQSFETYNSRLGELVGDIIKEKEAVPALI